MATPHDLEKIIKCLTVLALKAGNVAGAQRELKEAYGINVTRDLLIKWRDIEYAEEFRNIRDRYGDEFEREAVRNMRDRMMQAAEAEALAVQKVIEKLNNFQQQVSAKDASSAALNMSRVKQANVEKLLTLTNRPNLIIEDRTTEEALRRLRAKGIIKVVDELDDEGDE